MSSLQPEERLTSQFQDEDFLDPRVQFELERLNTATDLINKLEIELDEARSNFRLLLTESSQKINQLAKQLGSHVKKAEPYYEGRMRIKELHRGAERAARRCERAVLAHGAARDMVAAAEEGLGRRSCDPLFQEMLNRATLRVNEAERERVQSRLEHQKLSRECTVEEQRLAEMQVALGKSIAKASLSARRSMLQINAIAVRHELQLQPYFELKARLNEALEEQKKRAFQIEEDVMRVKFSYAEALHNLEEISDEMHSNRRAERRAEPEDWRRTAPRLAKSSSLSSSEMLKLYEDICNDDTYLRLPSKLCPSARSWKMRRAFSEDSHVPWRPPAESLRNFVSSSVGRVFPSWQQRGSRGLECVNVPPLKVLVAKVVDGMFPERPGIADRRSAVEDGAGECRHSKRHLEIPIPLAVPEDLSPAGTPDAEGPVRSARDPYRDRASGLLRTVDERSDSESPVGTPDDRQIDCLLLDRVLELDYQDVLSSCKDPSSS